MDERDRKGRGESEREDGLVMEEGRKQERGLSLVMDIYIGPLRIRSQETRERASQPALRTATARQAGEQGGAFFDERTSKYAANGI